MPGGDGTGPAGLGSMTGRAAGYGAGRPVRGYSNLVPRRGFWGWARGRGRGRGKGRGRGQGMGKGRGLGRGMGRGRGTTPSSGAAPPLQVGNAKVSAPTTPPPPPPSRSGNDQELEALKAQAWATEQKLRGINDKVSQMRVRGRRSSLVATVNTARCTGCGACAAVCPMGAIAVDAAASIETPNCTGCGLCVDECPQEAITLKRI